ncbi:ABC transporter ATP-binding protein [Paenibacillus guangzhouensis]|uniref:ABC transporter ATP-binding protein n=1 Tax=Paenibacillus guangzhouensis TaxID=1473112 RepID=UPI001266A49A|nr:ABC transporter ATP-binding protein [Paenibacillus guangzhouensis]
MTVEKPPLLRVNGLSVTFRAPGKVITAAENVSFEVQQGQIAALVGESGSGKSVTALSILGLLDYPGAVAQGEIWLDEVNLRACSPRELRRLRGREMGVIFQDPMNALNPVRSIGAQMIETIRLHRRVSWAEAKALAIVQLARVGLPDPAALMTRYAFQISGGMCQRVMIALALVSGPRLLIADEPTTALDMIVQARILRELDRIRRENGLGILLITHDWGVVAELADIVHVMKAGRIVESGSVFQIFENPEHPYTRELLNSR